MEKGKIRAGKFYKSVLFMLYTGLFVMCAGIPVKSAGAAIFVEQANSKAPEVRAYVQGSVNQGSTFKGRITGTDKNGNTASISLVQDGETKPASEEDGVTRYIFLIDNSGSVNEAQFKEVKNCLADFRKTLSKRTQDKMSVYTVGVKDANQRCGIVLDGVSGGGASGDAKKIRAIKRNGKKTVLYRTINEITGRTKSSKERVVLILLTDGEDDSTGSRNNPETTFSNVKNAAIPVYGILLNYGLSGDGDKKKIQVTKKLLNTEGSNDRMVRGIDISAKASAAAVEKAFANLLVRIQEKTFLVKLKAGSNRTLMNTRLTLTKTNGNVEEAKARDFSYSDYYPDKKPPQVSSLKVESENQISILVSDENGLDQPSIVNQANYKVYRTEGGAVTGGGNSVKTVELPSANERKKKKKVVLTLEHELEDGDYVLKLSGLKDASEDGNIIDKMEISFSVSGGIRSDAKEDEEVWEDLEETGSENQVMEKNSAAGFSYWWIVVPVLLAVIVVLILLLLKKKKTEETPAAGSYDGMGEADSCLITLTVTDGKGFTKNLQWDVEGSFFVGRSEICEVFFDDEMLSKQHFVIEVTKQGCFLEDLGSTNGTCVNGNRIMGRVEIFEGDEILAGREKFLVHSFRKGFDSVGTTSPV